MRYVFLAAGVLGAIVGYWFLWQELADRAQREAMSWADTQRNAGMDAGWASLSTSGFPYRIEVKVEGAFLADPKSPAQWRIESERLAAYIQPWNFGHVIFEAGGTQRLAWKVGDESRTASLRAEPTRASLVVDKIGKWERIAIDLPRLAMTIMDQEFTAERGQVHVRRTPSETPGLPKGVELSVSTNNLELPGAFDTALGRRISEVRLGAVIQGTLADGPFETVVQQWRDTGGTIEITGLQMKWGALDWRSSATLALDKQMRPIFAGTAEIRGFSEALDVLVESGQMRRGDAQGVRVALGLLAKRDGQGNSYVQVPLSAQDGKLYAGPVAIAKVPPLLPGTTQNPQ